MVGLGWLAGSSSLTLRSRPFLVGWWCVGDDDDDYDRMAFEDAELSVVFYCNLSAALR